MKSANFYILYIYVRCQKKDSNLIPSFPNKIFLRFSNEKRFYFEVLLKDFAGTLIFATCVLNLSSL